MNKRQVISCIAPQHYSQTGRSSVEILEDESVVSYVWCGSGVPTRSVTRGGAVGAYPSVQNFTALLEKYVWHSLKVLGIV